MQTMLLFAIINRKMGICCGMDLRRTTIRYHILPTVQRIQAICFIILSPIYLFLSSGHLYFMRSRPECLSHLADFSATVAECRNKAKIIVNFPLRLSAEFVC